MQNMVWDPSGERLAVHFAPNEDYTSPLVAVFQTRIHPVLEIMPCGFVRGDLGETPHIITFQPKFDMGALLTIVSMRVLEYEISIIVIFSSILKGSFSLAPDE